MVVVVFGCDLCLKGLWVVVGSGAWVVVGLWVRCLGRGSGVWVVGDGVGLWWLWVFFFLAVTGA